MTRTPVVLTTHLPPAGTRSQDLVFTLFGDYLLERDDPVWVGSLITLLGDLGLSPTAVRTVLSRMARKRWLFASRRGTRSFYGLTTRGRRLLEAGRQRIYHPPRDEPWDGSWYLITYSIPEERRRRRDSLRLTLLWLGCGLLSNGLWITPHDVRAEVDKVAGSLRVRRHLEVFRAEHSGFLECDRSGAAVLEPACAQRPLRRVSAALERAGRPMPRLHDARPVARAPSRTVGRLHRTGRMLSPAVPHGTRVPVVPAG